MRFKTGEVTASRSFRRIERHAALAINNPECCFRGIPDQ
jgi:hypothetical protein